MLITSLCWCVANFNLYIYLTCCLSVGTWTCHIIADWPSISSCYLHKWKKVSCLSNGRDWKGEKVFKKSVNPESLFADDISYLGAEWN